MNFKCKVDNPDEFPRGGWLQAVLSWLFGLV